ncbi:MBG domain-containing protein [Mucilaginibacter myungsuensis]|uniref:Gliding motility-associated C-terminal domain-containing protein n=1 Tax=Mucilaginibacter myungsuensis TaxID=649104 RepID=A0A929KYN4_9SPHI|nr:MBG domain-containing protein [Mucilaginibacter myungsuensis]MBE9661020.1 gliding motility-associated C-terminal domain-containing protein [Mucilaginibacter myungsuensis]MDN3597164.1 MBG domain-containing protein [Mucilaginibacter myungsuensis]
MMRKTVIIFCLLFATIFVARAQVINLMSPAGLTFTGTYGTASNTRTFSISGSALQAGILVTPPPGYQVSLNNIAYSNTITVGAAGEVDVTNIFIRLPATANAGDYVGDVVLTSPGALTVSGPSLSGTVNPFVLNLFITIRKPYGYEFPPGVYDYTELEFREWNGLLKNGNKVNSIDISITAGNSRFDKAGPYPGSVVIKDFTGRDGYLPGNYIVNFRTGDNTIYAADLMITANNVTKNFGTDLSNVPNSTQYTVLGLQNGETIGTVDIAYLAGAAAAAPPGRYQGAVEASNVKGGNIDRNNYNLLYIKGDLTVLSTTPEITATTTPVVIIACEGTPSSGAGIQQVTVSGKNIATGITAAAPTNFEVGLSVNGPFSTAVLIPAAAGVVTNATVYVRTAASAPAGLRTGFVVLSSSGAQNQFAEVSGTINMSPTVDRISAQTYRNGQVTTPIALSGSGNIFNWTNSNTAIGLGASGVGVIPAFSAINRGTSTVTATITVTPRSLPLLQVLTQGSNAVTSFNTIDGKQEAVISISPNITSIAISPDSKRIYGVQRSATGNLYGYKVANGVLESSITSGAASGKMVISPDGNKAFVPVSSASTSYLHAINTGYTPFTGDNYIELSSPCVGTAITPDGKSVYVLSNLPDAVTAINTNNYADKKSVTGSLATFIQHAVTSTDGSKLFVAGTGVSIINTATNAVIRNIATGITAGDIAVSADGNTLYVSQPSADRLLIFDVNTGNLLTQIAVGKRPTALALSADGTRLYVANSGETSVSEIDVAARSVIKAIQTGTAPLQLGLVGGTSCPGVPEQFTITVGPTSRFDLVSGPSALETEFGTNSAVSNFVVSGINLTQPVTITAPPGFSINVNGIGFSGQQTFPAGWFANNSNNTLSISIRLNANTDAGPHSGNIVLTTSAADPLNIPMPVSTVRPAPLTLVANEYLKPYGESLLTPVLRSQGLTITAGGLKNGNTIITATYNYGSGRNANDDAGRYANSITVGTINGEYGFKESNYAITRPILGDIVITKAPLIIKANNIEKTYGDVLTNGAQNSGITVTGLKGQDRAGIATISFGEGAAATAAVKEYPGSVTITGVTGGTFKPTNYEFNGYGTGDIIVKKAQLTITPDNATRMTGQENPSFTADIKGFVNGEDASVLTRQPVITTTASRTSVPGTYPITATNADAANYTMVYTPGTLTITLAPVINLVIPNTITPNGDGINDTWVIGNMFAYPKATINVYNRLGHPVFTSIGYTTPWDGKYKGQNLNAGVYYYVIQTGLADKPLSGSITLIR